MNDRIPAFKITISDRDVTHLISQRFVSLTLTECRSDESDQLDITLDDADGKMALPSNGAKIGVHIGWKGSGLVDKGLFNVDDVEHSGPPDIVTIHARAANLIDTFKQLQERSFHETTLGAIINVIAFENELVPAVSAGLRDTVIEHIAQTHESDAAFLRRLGKKYDAVATVKNDRLLFIPIGQSRTASGKALPLITILRNQGDSHRYRAAGRSTFSGVRAFWYDGHQAHRHSVVAGKSGNCKRIRTTFANEIDARTAAVSEWQRVQRGLATFDMALAVGNPLVTPESPVAVRGYKSVIDETDWLCLKVTHSIGDAGFTSHVAFETKSDTVEAEREHDIDPDEGVTGVIAMWRDVVTKKTGEMLAGTHIHPKVIKHVYANKYSAKRAAKLEWGKIKERREIIKENNGAGLREI